MLIEVQHTITMDFIDRLLGYALCIKKEYKAKPTVVVFSTHATRNDVSLDFEATPSPLPNKSSVNTGQKNASSLITTWLQRQPQLFPPLMMAIAYFFFLHKNSPYYQLNARMTPP